MSAIISLLVVSVPWHTCLAQPLPSLNGPVAIRNQFPLSAAHLSVLPQVATIFPEDSGEVSLSTAWSNSFVREESYRVDGESNELRARGRWGVGSRSELLMEIPFFWAGGGVLDQPIDAWHRWWGFPRGGREQWPEDAFDLSGITQTGERFSIPQYGMRLGNIVLGGKRSLFESSERAFAAIAELSLPKMTTGYAHQGTDINLGLLWTEHLPWVALHSGVSLLWYSSGQYYGIPFSRIHSEAFVSFEKPLFAGLTLLGTVTASSKTVRDIEGFPEYALYLDVGGRIAIDDRRAVVVACRENPAPGDGTTDVTFLLLFEQSLTKPARH